MEEQNFEVVWSKIILNVKSDKLRFFSKEIFNSMCYENLNQIKMIDLTFLQRFMNTPLSLSERIFDIVKKTTIFLKKTNFVIFSLLSITITSIQKLFFSSELLISITI